MQCCTWRERALFNDTSWEPIDWRAGLQNRPPEEVSVDSHLHIMCLDSKGSQRHPGLCYQEHASRSGEETVHFYSAHVRLCLDTVLSVAPTAHTRKTVTNRRECSREPLRWLRAGAPALRAELRDRACSA